MQKSRRALAWVFCCAFVLTLFTSSVFILHEAHHDCTGEDCPVCRQVALAASVLRCLGLALLWALAFLLPHRVLCVFGGGRRIRCASPITLVTCKVRLNN